MEILWSLGHKKLRTVDKNIYSNQLAQKVIDGKKSGSTEDDWVVWQPGWAAWQNLTENANLMLEIKTLQSIQEKMELTNAAPPPLMDGFSSANTSLNSNLKSTVTSTASSISSTDISSKKIPSNTSSTANLQHSSKLLSSEKPLSETTNKNWTELRKHNRVEVRLRCIIRSHTLTFRTFTKDISLGGVALEDPIPADFTDKECNIYITAIHIKRNLKFNLKMTQRPGAKFFSFESAEQPFKDELNSWLEEYMNIQNKDNKAS